MVVLQIQLFFSVTLKVDFPQRFNPVKFALGKYKLFLNFLLQNYKNT